MEPVKLTCPNCHNSLFHCGLQGEPYWCGACNWRGHRDQARAVCPKCERPTAKGVETIDTSLKCPEPSKPRKRAA